jgi:hypothetical protein
VNLREQQRAEFSRLCKQDWHGGRPREDGGCYLKHSLNYLLQITRVPHTDVSWGALTPYALEIYLNQVEAAEAFKTFFGAGRVQENTHWRDGTYYTFILDLEPQYELEEQ